MRINQCDVCKKSVGNLNTIQFEIAQYLPSEIKDICDDCKIGCDKFYHSQRLLFFNKLHQDVAEYIRELADGT